MRVPEGFELNIPSTPFHLTAHSLCHGDCFPSTAFLIRAEKDHLLYLGDTGPDAIEPEPKLDRLWTSVAPRIASGALRAMFIECSYDNSRPDNLLFGHLTPKWLATEMVNLAGKVSNISRVPWPDALRNVSIIVTHIKPSFDPRVNIRSLLLTQLRQNAVQMGFRTINFRMVQQGVPFFPEERNLVLKGEELPKSIETELIEEWL